MIPEPSTSIRQHMKENRGRVSLRTARVTWCEAFTIIKYGPGPAYHIEIEGVGDGEKGYIVQWIERDDEKQTGLAEVLVVHPHLPLGKRLMQSARRIVSRAWSGLNVLS